jgi:hypothetical protein
LEDLKKKLKNYKNDEEENNIDDMEIELLTKNEGETKVGNNSKSKVEQKKNKNRAIKEADGEGEGEGDEQEPKKMSRNNGKKRGNKKNKIQQQRIKKKKIMSFYFFKENLFFAIKTSMILICFVSFFIVSFLIYKQYLKSFLKFDSLSNSVENLYYESIRIFLIFKSELLKFDEYKDENYNMSIPQGKDIQMPDFGNTLNDLSQDGIFSNENKEIFSQLYNGDLCLLLFVNTESLDYINCKEFLSSILLKGMEQAIIQLGVMVNSVIDELTLINDQKDFYNIVKGNYTSFKKYETFIEYYLLLSYLKNEEIFNNFSIDEANYFKNLTMKLIIIYFIVYVVLFIMLCYFIFMYKYIYNSLFNFIAILSIKFISDDEYLNKKIIELEKKLYK